MGDAVRALTTLAALAALATAGCSDAPSTATPVTAAVATSVTTSATTAVDGPGSLLPAGAVVVFQRDRIMIAEAGGGAASPAAPAVPGGQEHPDWSPDGQQLVFETDFAQLWIAPVDGGEADAVVDCAAPCVAIQDGAWSPDGTQVAFVRAESDDGVHTSRSSIAILTVASGEVRDAHSDGSGRVWLFQPRWSPDGTQLVFNEATYASDMLDEEAISSERIAIVDASGGDDVRYLTEPGDDATTPDWSPTDDLIVFVRDSNLVTMRPDGSEQVEVTDFDGLEEHAIQPTFLPDGRGFIFTHVIGQFGVDDVPAAAVIALDGTGLVDLPIGRATHARVAPFPSAASIAGHAVDETLLFEWYPRGSDHKTIMTIDPTEVTRVLEPVAGTAFVHADWSPDGEAVVFEALDDDGVASIVRADAALSAIVPVAECLAPPCLQLAWPAWSHDGSRITVVQYDEGPANTWGPSHLVVIDLDSGERTTVSSTADGATAYYKPRWSPDDEHLVVQIETSPDATQSTVTGSTLAVVPVAGGELVPITEPSLFAAHPDWHPDGGSIVFQTFDFGPFDDEPSELYTVDADGSDLRRIPTSHPAGSRIGAPTWTPDGSAIVAMLGFGADHDPPVEVVRVDPLDGTVVRLGVTGAGPRPQPTNPSP